MTATPIKLANLEPNPYGSFLLLFDRKGWKCMAFGEFAERAKPKDGARGDLCWAGLVYDCY